MENDSIRMSISEHIAHIELNRPEKGNSLTAEFWVEFPSLIERLSAGGQARVLLISGAGKHFCTGMDLSVFAESKNIASDTALERECLRNLVIHLQEALSSLERARIPVIALVSGACLGAGLDLICACDFVYATNNAYFGIQEINLGIMADLGTLQRLPRKMPQGLVRELAYSGIRLDANRAAQSGFVNELFESKEAMLDAGMRTARAIAAKYPLAVSATKESLNYSTNHSTAESLLHAANLQAFVFESETVRKMLDSGGRADDTTSLKPVCKSV